MPAISSLLGHPPEHFCSSGPRDATPRELGSAEVAPVVEVVVLFSVPRLRGGAVEHHRIPEVLENVGDRPCC